MHLICETQDVSAPVEEVWEFLKNPKNLNQITPSDLRFEFLDPLPEEMYNGLILRYRIQIPLFGRWNWVTEIKHIRDGVAFVDEQRFGPYRFWHHYHEARPIPGGTRIIDRVHYMMPFGSLGKLVHALFVRRMVGQIFAHRRIRLEEIFGPPPPKP